MLIVNKAIHPVNMQTNGSANQTVIWQMITKWWKESEELWYEIWNMAAINF